MNGHWYIVASQKSVRVFTEVAAKPRIKLIQTVENPLAQEKKKDLVKKQAGKAVKSAGRFGVSRHVEIKNDPREQSVLQFARQIAKFLDGEKKQKNFQSLTIVAEPHFLGRVKSELTPAVKKTVTDWIQKDLQKTSKKQLEDFLLQKKIVFSDPR